MLGEDGDAVGDAVIGGDAVDAALGGVIEDTALCLVGTGVLGKEEDDDLDC